MIQIPTGTETFGESNDPLFIPIGSELFFFFPKSAKLPVIVRSVWRHRFSSQAKAAQERVKVNMAFSLPGDSFLGMSRSAHTRHGEFN